MHKKFAEYFIDPITNEPLELLVTERQGDIIISGSLKSSSSEFPIIRGIPRFVDFELKNYTDSFSYEWKRWPKVQFESENLGKPMEGHTQNMWENITGISNNNLKGKTILDIGCGSGRFIDIARRKGATVIGLDYSASVEVVNRNFIGDDNVCICQADALNLPFKKNSLDGAYSIGVLQFTPDSAKGVSEAFKILNKDGWLAITVYLKGSQYDNPVTHAYRKLFRFLSHPFKYYPALMYSIFIVYFLRLFNWIKPLRKVLKIIFPNIYLKSIKWSILDTFDMVTPTFQKGYIPYEIFQWFKSSGFREIEPTNWGFTSFKGKK